MFSVILFGAIPADKIAVAVLALITAALLFNLKKYFARQSPAKKGCPRSANDAEYLTSREIAAKNAQIKPSPTFTGVPKPEMIAHWEVEFFELTRQMTAQIDMKMSALSNLSKDASRICQRMETLLDRLDKTIAAPSETPLPRPEETLRYSRNSPEPMVSSAPPAPPIPPISPVASLSPSPEPVREKKSLFPRLSTLPGLNFTDDFDDLAAIGADLLPEKPYGKSQPEQALSEFRRSPSLRPIQEFRPQRPNSAPPPADHTLGELLLQEKSQNQSAKLQPIPTTASTLQPTPIESIFKPLEPRPTASRPAPQIIPRERVG